MNWGNYLFGFDGRINRAKIWLFVLIAILVYIVFGIVFTIAFGASFVALLMTVATRPTELFAGGGPALVSVAVFCAFYVVVFYVGLAVSAKRLHDRNKSAVWLLLFIVLPAVLNFTGLAMAPSDLSTGAPSTNPVALILKLVSFAISLWAFVELYCLRGAVGDNRYGADPLAAKT